MSALRLIFSFSFFSSFFLSSRAVSFVQRGSLSLSSWRSYPINWQGSSGRIETIVRACPKKMGFTLLSLFTPDRLHFPFFSGFVVRFAFAFDYSASYIKYDTDGHQSMIFSLSIQLGPSLFHNLWVWWINPPCDWTEACEMAQCCVERNREGCM